MPNRFPLTKDVVRVLEDTVARMPKVWQTVKQETIMSKEELVEMGYVGAEKLKDGTKHVYSEPVHLATNHLRKLKQCYKKGGSDGCVEYLRHIKEIATPKTKTA